VRRAEEAVEHELLRLAPNQASRQADVGRAASEPSSDEAEDAAALYLRPADHARMSGALEQWHFVKS
jgi:hypothetical protein